MQPASSPTLRTHPAGAAGGLGRTRAPWTLLPGPGPARHPRGCRPGRLRPSSMASPPEGSAHMTAAVRVKLTMCCQPPTTPLSGRVRSSGRPLGYRVLGSGWLGPDPDPRRTGSQVQRPQYSLEPGRGTRPGTQAVGPRLMGRPPPPALGVRSHRSRNCGRSLEEGRVTGPRGRPQAELLGRAPRRSSHPHPPVPSGAEPSV